MAISASLPSGSEDVVHARRMVSDLLYSAGTLPLVEFGNNDFIPLVCHMNCGPHRHRPDAVFVGECVCAADVSPWSRPLPLGSFHDNAAFLESRLDLRVFLWPLRNKFVCCDCANESHECWAFFLVDTFVETLVPEYFSGGIWHIYSGSDWVESDDGYHNVINGEYGLDSISELFGHHEGYRERHRNLASGGRQGSRNRPTQLIPDGLSPEDHVSQAFQLVHPFLQDKPSTTSVRRA